MIRKRYGCDPGKLTLDQFCEAFEKIALWEKINSPKDITEIISEISDEKNNALEKKIKEIEKRTGKKLIKDKKSK